MLYIVALFIFQESTYVVKATIKHVLDHDDWWYIACICNKAVYPHSKMFFVKNVTSMSLRLHLGNIINLQNCDFKFILYLTLI